MMPSDILSSEHRMIERAMDCLEQIAMQTESSGRLDVGLAGAAVDFFRNFADRYHHGKEESHFFPAMESRGFPREAGPVGVMLYEHELGRRRVAAMDEAISVVSGGIQAAARQFAENARAFIALLRNHIEKEDHCLFSMANQAFTADDQQNLLDAFAEVELADGGKSEQTYTKLIEAMNSRLLP